MSYFPPYLDETGIHMPTYEERLEDLLSAYRTIFGTEAELSPAVPDYQLLSVFARALDDVSALVVRDFASRNPAYAAGSALDLLLPLYGLTRRGETAAEAPLSLTGSAGTVIPAGSSAGDSLSRPWFTDADAVLPSSGTASVPAHCGIRGQAWAAAGTITRILSPVSGWTGVTNPEASTTGLAADSDAAVRNRIRAAMALRGTSSPDAMAAAVSQVPNVRKVKIYSNPTDETDARGIPAHSIAPVVLGGAANALAEAIGETCPPGIPTWGSASGAYTPPGGTEETVYFTRAAGIQVTAVIQLVPLEGFFLSAVAGTISDAVSEYVSGLSIGEGLAVSKLYPEIFRAVPEQAGTFYVRSLSVYAGGTPVSEAIQTPWNKRLYATAGDIYVNEVSP